MIFCRVLSGITIMEQKEGGGEEGEREREGEGEGEE